VLDLRGCQSNLRLLHSRHVAGAEASPLALWSKGTRRRNQSKVRLRCDEILDCGPGWYQRGLEERLDRWHTESRGQRSRQSSEIQRAKIRFGLPKDAAVFSCYEAGRNGFWIDHFLRHSGINNLVVDSSSVEVNRRARRAKGDSLVAISFPAVHSLRLVRDESSR
jgi:hypothetical protein